MKGYLERAEEPLPGEEDSPLLELLGIVEEGPTDGALHHDRYLFGGRG